MMAAEGGAISRQTVVESGAGLTERVKQQSLTSEFSGQQKAQLFDGPLE